MAFRYQEKAIVTKIVWYNNLLQTILQHLIGPIALLPQCPNAPMPYCPIALSPYCPIAEQCFFAIINNASTIICIYCVNQNVADLSMKTAPVKMY